MSVELFILTEITCAFVLWANYDGFLCGEAQMWGWSWRLHVGFKEPQPKDERRRMHSQNLEEVGAWRCVRDVWWMIGFYRAKSERLRAASEGFRRLVWGILWWGHWGIQRFDVCVTFQRLLGDEADGGGGEYWKMRIYNPTSLLLMLCLVLL